MNKGHAIILCRFSAKHMSNHTKKTKKLGRNFPNSFSFQDFISQDQQQHY